MVTTKSIRESRRARGTPSAKAFLTPPDVATPADSPRKPISAAVGNQHAAEVTGSLVKLALLRVTTTAFLALKHQNVERHWDVACALQFSVVDPISSIEEDAWRIVSARGGESPEEELL